MQAQTTFAHGSMGLWDEYFRSGHRSCVLIQPEVNAGRILWHRTEQPCRLRGPRTLGPFGRSMRESFIALFINYVLLKDILSIIFALPSQDPRGDRCAQE